MPRSSDSSCKILLALVLLNLPACKGNSSSKDYLGNGDGGIGCREDPRGEIYTANMQKLGTSGKLTFLLVQSEPAPPVKGTNTWTLRLLDESGTTVTGANLNVRPFMPDHGHGTSVVPEVRPTADSYSIKPVHLFMAGLWQVTISAQAASVSDSAMFTFCIEG